MGCHPAAPALHVRAPRPLVVRVRSAPPGSGSSAPPAAAKLPDSLQKIVGAFQMVPDPMARYKQLLFYATKLQKLPAEDHVPANKVEGCVSQARGGRAACTHLLNAQCSRAATGWQRWWQRWWRAARTRTAHSPGSHALARAQVWVRPELCTSTRHARARHALARAQVWVKPELRADGKLYWSADSDSQLTKGLAALLVLGLSGCTPQEILQLQARAAQA